MQAEFKCPYCSTTNQIGDLSIALAANAGGVKTFVERCMDLHGKGCGRRVAVEVLVESKVTTMKIEGEEHGNQ